MKIIVQCKDCIFQKMLSCKHNSPGAERECNAFESITEKKKAIHI